MKKDLKYWILAVAAIACCFVLGKAYTYKYRTQQTIIVTGLGETTFDSDLIVWNATLQVETHEVTEGYARLKHDKAKVEKFLSDRGVDPQTVVFSFVSVNKEYTDNYAPNGNWAGRRFSGYSLSQTLSIESQHVDQIEAVSRGISELISQGISIEASAPAYYYTRLDDVKLGLIETASANARQRAEKIAENAGTKLGDVKSARMGVFQITGTNTNEEFTAGGSFNTSSRTKKARITAHIEYRVK